MFADSSGKFQVNVRFQVRSRFNLSNGRQKKAKLSEFIVVADLDDAVERRNH